MTFSSTLQQILFIFQYSKIPGPRFARIDLDWLIFTLVTKGTKTPPPSTTTSCFSVCNGQYWFCQLDQSSKPHRFASLWNKRIENSNQFWIAMVNIDLWYHSTVFSTKFASLKRWSKNQALKSVLCAFIGQLDAN